MSVKLYYLGNNEECYILAEELLKLNPYLVRVLEYKDCLEDHVIKYLYEYQESLLDNIFLGLDFLFICIFREYLLINNYRISLENTT
jgi:hypothetical protein